MISAQHNNARKKSGIICFKKGKKIGERLESFPRLRINCCGWKSKSTYMLYVSAEFARQFYRNSISTFMRPCLGDPSRRNASRVKSMTRPFLTNRRCGPRSFTRTITDFPFSRFVTLIYRLKPIPQIAQVKSWSLKISLLAVRLLMPGDLREYHEAFPSRVYFWVGAAVTFSDSKRGNIPTKRVTTASVIIFLNFITSALLQG